MAEDGVSCGLAALYVPAEADRVHSFVVTSPGPASARTFSRLRAAALERRQADLDAEMARHRREV